MFVCLPTKRICLYSHFAFAFAFAFIVYIYSYLVLFVSMATPPSSKWFVFVCLPKKSCLFVFVFCLFTWYMVDICICCLYILISICLYQWQLPPCSKWFVFVCLPNKSYLFNLYFVCYLIDICMCCLYILISICLYQ